MLGKSGSEIKYLVALSNGANATAGSTNASNFAGYEFGTLLVADASAPAAGGLTVNMIRSGTSDGTFASFGASMNYLALALHGLRVRSWVLDSSACWYKVSYDSNNGASSRPTIIIALQTARGEPVTSQASDTTIFSTILGG